MEGRVTTDQLIAQLRDDARPVRRLRPPLVRASLWLLVIATIAVPLIWRFSDLQLFMRRAEDPKLALELTGTLLTGIAATISAFHLSLPDRPARWALLPLVPLLLWIGASGYSCWRHWITVGPDGWVLGESAECFIFILAVSIPLGTSLLLLLRRARPLTPVRVAVFGGLGVAALSAFILQFFHPFDVTFLDLGAHLAAVGLVILLSGAIGRLLRARISV
ncbi:MAG TPA: NrsF family protein [Aliidongia sp.]|nr:NrsF family protein [Aliidongia sp.]